MPWIEPQPLTVPVEGGELHAGRWGSGSTVVLASHGITANHRSFGQLAWALERRDADVTLVAVDHRGRGGSATHPGPYGLRSHAADLLATLDHLDAERAVVVGHSMGAYVAVNAAELAPARVPALVLVDGGLPPPVPPPADADVEALVRSVIGPALDRLEMTFASPEAYLEYWRAHPAFASSGLNDVVEAHLRHDLVRDGQAWRSSVSKQAVLDDGRDVLLDEAVRCAVERIDQPTALLWAPRGMLDQEPGLLPGDLVGEATARLAHLEAHRVADVNHYTILFSPDGADHVASALVASR